MEGWHPNVHAMEYVRRAGEMARDQMIAYGFEPHEVVGALMGFNGMLWVEYGVRTT